LEHPDIYVPDSDSTHFFTFNYVKGLDWYKELFYSGWSNQSVVGDTTPSYIRDEQAPRRIFDYNPNSKIIFSLRNPIDRAFSHYWHEKKKGKIAFEFCEVLENYDLYHNWVVAGFYHLYLQRFYEYFPSEQVLVMIYEDLLEDPSSFIREIFEFLEVDPNFIPSVLHRRVNKAWGRPKGFQKVKRDIYTILSWPIRQLIPKQIRESLKKQYLGAESPVKAKTEYDYGMDEDVRARLCEIFRPENEKLSALIDKDLSRWV
jgi:hypothetical protein